MQEMINIRNEEKADYAIVEQITREAFTICMFPDASSIIWCILCGNMRILYRSWTLSWS